MMSCYDLKIDEILTDRNTEQIELEAIAYLNNSLDRQAEQDIREL